MYSTMPVPYRTVPFRTVTYCTVTYYTVTYCTVTYCTVTYCTVDINIKYSYYFLPVLGTLRNLSGPPPVRLVEPEPV